MDSKKIGVIGGSGFVGTRLCKRFLSSNMNFSIFDLVMGDAFPKKTTQGDVCATKDLINYSETIDTLINLAAVHRDDEDLIAYENVNVGGAVSICKTARKNGIQKIIFTSSVAVYGFADEDTDENGKINYFNDYGRTKYLAEQVLKEWLAEDPLNRTLVIIRPTVIFGEGNRGNVYNLLNQIASKKFIMFGKGVNKKSMAYVENVAAFIEHSLSFSEGLHVYNYIDKPDLDINNLVKIARNTLFGKDNVGLRLPAFIGIAIGYTADFVSKILNKNLPVSSIRVKKFMGTTKFHSSAIDTSFLPPVNLEQALKSTIQYEFIEDNSDKRTFDTE